MIITQLNGGLGNQMFQYATGRSLACHNNTQLKLDISQFHQDNLREYCLSPFNITENIASQADLNRVNRPLAWKVKNPVKTLKSVKNRKTPITYVKERDFNFNPEILKLPDNIYLEGYWQTEQYFKRIEPILQKDFSLKITLGTIIHEMSERIVQDGNAVSVHVRRGDYVTDPETNKTHGVCTIDYYERALEKMMQNIDNVKFFIFSDDPNWVKENISLDAPSYCVSDHGLKNYEEQYLMSLCRHHIIANSSFSWWGAWICSNPEKIIIAPKKWFNRSEINTNDLIPKSWIRL